MFCSPSVFLTPFHETGLFLHPLKTLQNLSMQRQFPTGACKKRCSGKFWKTVMKKPWDLLVNLEEKIRATYLLQNSTKSFSNEFF